MPRTVYELMVSAGRHPQHHAAASAVPAGRRGDAKRPRGEDDDDGADASDGDDDDAGCGEFR